MQMWCEFLLTFGIVFLDAILLNINIRAVPGTRWVGLGKYLGFSKAHLERVLRLYDGKGNLKVIVLDWNAVWSVGGTREQARITQASTQRHELQGGYLSFPASSMIFSSCWALSIYWTNETCSHRVSARIGEERRVLLWEKHIYNVRKNTFFNFI